MEVGATPSRVIHRPPVRTSGPLVGYQPFPTAEVRDSSSMKRAKGFTLIELLIAVAIVGILAAIAIPSYQFAVRKGNRGDAQAFMMDVAQREQQIYVDSRAYVDVADNASFDDINMTVPERLANLYDFSVEHDPADLPPKFTITAVAKGKQVADGDLSLDSTGAKTPPANW